MVYLYWAKHIIGVFKILFGFILVKSRYTGGSIVKHLFSSLSQVVASKYLLLQRKRSYRLRLSSGPKSDLTYSIPEFLEIYK